MRIYFSLKVTVIGGILIAGMLRASLWQWHRHLGKQELISQMQRRLELPIEDLADFLSLNPSEPVENLLYRRFQVEGQFDFKREMIVRNRKHGDLAGMHVITPVRLKDGKTHVLINRGFIPMEQSKAEQRKIFHRENQGNFVGLVKESAEPSWYSPKDAEVGGNREWLDAWQRVDLKKMQRQLPYKIAPFYLELMSVLDPRSVEKEVVKADSGREELLLMGLKQVSQFNSNPNTLNDFPIASFETVIPPGRHLGYVYEWAFMALMTFLICLVLQLRPPRGFAPPTPRP